MTDEAPSAEPGETAASETQPRDRLSGLVRRDDFLLCDPEELVDFDWSPYLDVPED